MASRAGLSQFPDCCAANAQEAAATRAAARRTFPERGTITESLPEKGCVQVQQAFVKLQFDTRPAVVGSWNRGGGALVGPASFSPEARMFITPSRLFAL